MSRYSATFAAISMTSLLMLSGAVAQTTTPSAVDKNVATHIAAAMAVAGQRWQADAQMLCKLSARSQSERPMPSSPRRLPQVENWPEEPLKIFDNLYFVGSKGVSAFAVTTSQGIIITDAMWDYDVEQSVVGGLQKLGLEPAQIKYVIIPHGHPDHFGGAQLLHDRFGAMIVAPRNDMQFMAGFAKFDPTPMPKAVDMLAADGDRIVLGDTTINFVEVPGHTPGGLAMLIPVRAAGQQHSLLIWAVGSATPNGQENLQKQIAAISHLTALVKSGKVDAFTQNHDAHLKVEQMRHATPEQPNPFLVGTDNLLDYLKVRSECDQAQLAMAQQ